MELHEHFTNGPAVLPLLTVADVAIRLQVHPETVRRWIKAGELGHIGLGGKGRWLRVSEGQLAEFVAVRSRCFDAQWAADGTPAA